MWVHFIIFMTAFGTVLVWKAGWLRLDGIADKESLRLFLIVAVCGNLAGMAMTLTNGDSEIYQKGHRIEKSEDRAYTEELQVSVGDGKPEKVAVQIPEKETEETEAENAQVKQSPEEMRQKELKEVINTNADPAQSGQTKLEAQLKMANLQFPMQASEEVIVEKIEVIGESVVYICSVDEELCPISQIEENAAEVKEGIVSTLASQTDPATQIFIKTCVDNNKSIAYRYIGKESGQQYDVIIPLSDLKKMLIEK